MTKQSIPRPSIPMISADADIIYRRLSKLEPGEHVTYEELDRLIGRPVRDSRGILVTARKKASREDGVVLVTVRNEGLKRAKDGDYAGIVHGAISHIRKTAKRRLRESLMMPREEYEAAAADMKTQLNLARSQLGTLAHFASSAVAKKLEHACVNDRIAVGRVLELCK